MIGEKMVTFDSIKAYRGKEVCSTIIDFVCNELDVPFFIISASGKRLIANPETATIKIIDKDGNEIDECFQAEFCGLYEYIGGVGWYDGAYYILLYNIVTFNFVILKISEDGKLIGEAKATNPLPILLGNEEDDIIRARNYMILEDDKYLGYYARFTTVRGKPEFIVSMHKTGSPNTLTARLLFIATPDFERGKINVELLHNYLSDYDMNQDVFYRFFVYKDNVYTFSVRWDLSSENYITIDKINILNKHLERHRIDLSKINPEFKKPVPIFFSYSMPYIHKGKPFVAIVDYNKYDVSKNLVRAFIYVISLDGKPSIVKHNVKIFSEKESTLRPIVFIDSNDVAVSARISEIRNNEIILELEGTDNIMLHLVFKEKLISIKEDDIRLYGEKIGLFSFDIVPSTLALIYSPNEKKRTIRTIFRRIFAFNTFPIKPIRLNFY